MRSSRLLRNRELLILGYFDPEKNTYLFTAVPMGVSVGGAGITVESGRLVLEGEGVFVGSRVGVSVGVRVGVNVTVGVGVAVGVGVGTWILR